jgi:hypothetical protein
MSSTSIWTSSNLPNPKKCGFVPHFGQTLSISRINGRERKNINNTNSAIQYDGLPGLWRTRGITISKHTKPINSDTKDAGWRLNLAKRTINNIMMEKGSKYFKIVFAKLSVGSPFLISTLPPTNRCWSLYTRDSKNEVSPVRLGVVCACFETTEFRSEGEILWNPSWSFPSQLIGQHVLAVNDLRVIDIFWIMTIHYPLRNSR